MGDLFHDVLGGFFAALFNMSNDARHDGTVVVVDDDRSVRESLEALLRWVGWQVEVHDSAISFLAAPPLQTDSCLVLDVHLPDMNGLELQQRMISSGKSMPIIFITGNGDIPMTVRAIKGGATEFLLKPFEDQALLDAIELAMARSRTIRHDKEELRQLHARYESMTPRERQVMELVVRGLLNKQVGAELGSAEQTVKAHRGQVMRKMRADSLADLVRMSERLGLAQVPRY